MISPLRFLRKLLRPVKSRPETEIEDKRLAFSIQNPSIHVEPSYKTASKQVKMSISQKAQGFLKIFRVQHVALIVSRPKHPCSACCYTILHGENRRRGVRNGAGVRPWGHKVVGAGGRGCLLMCLRSCMLKRNMLRHWVMPLTGIACMLSNGVLLERH